MAVLAPMPSASVMTQTAVNIGCLIKLRSPYWKSFSMVFLLVPQRDQWIDCRGAARGKQTGEQRRDQTNNTAADEDKRIRRRNTEQQARHQTRQTKRGSEPDCRTGAS